MFPIGTRRSPSHPEGERHERMPSCDKGNARHLRAVGGSGLTRESVIRPAVLPALLQPALPVSRQFEQVSRVSTSLS